MDEFIHYMKVLGRKPYYINRHIMWIKSVHKQAYKRNKISFKPVEDMDLLKVKQELPKVLERWEVDKVYEYKFKKSLQEVADAWVFCQETSFSYADYISLRDEFLNVDDEGIYWIIFPREKVEKIII
jgi:site-specific recombinase XerD